MWNPSLRTVVRPFDEIVPAVLGGDVDAGVVIHEGQLTWKEQGLARLGDLGRWWAAFFCGDQRLSAFHRSGSGSGFALRATP